MSWRVINIETGISIGVVDDDGILQLDAPSARFDPPAELEVLHSTEGSGSGVTGTFVKRGDDLYIAALDFWFQQLGYILELEEIAASSGGDAATRRAVRIDVYRAREGKV